MNEIIEVDPTELLPGDVVVKLGDHDLAGCHCDVRVTVLRGTGGDDDAAADAREGLYTAWEIIDDRPGS